MRIFSVSEPITDFSLLSWKYWTVLTGAFQQKKYKYTKVNATIKGTFPVLTPGGVLILAYWKLTLFERPHQNILRISLFHQLDHRIRLTNVR